MIAPRISLATLTLLSAIGTASADGPAGAASCSGCHANNARVETPVPPLKGKPAGDISAAMTEYKTGKRAGTIMDRIAKGFSDEEIQAIAKWYAEQK